MSTSANPSGSTAVKAIYVRDSKRYHRYSIGDIGDDLTGAIYVKKGMPIPETLKIKFIKPSESDT